jgi:hypothetical protein
MKIGIDPTGGSNWASPNVVWSGTQNPYDAYAPFAIEAVSQSSVVTVFTYAYQSEPRKHNDIYWDDASLTVVGGAVAPQQPQQNSNQQAAAVNWEATRQVRAAAWEAQQQATASAQEQAQADFAAQQAQEQADADAAQAIASVPEGAVADAQPVAAVPDANTIPFYLPVLPTPNAEGVILVAVPPGGSVWSVAANAGISLAEIQSLNNLAPNQFVNAGDLLIVGYGDPNGIAAEEEAVIEAESETEIAAADTVEVAPPVLIPTPKPIPTPNVAPAVEVADADTTADTAICLKAFDDANKNGLHDPGEGLRASVAFTLANGQRVVSNYVTTGTDEPYCIEGLEEGNYQISRSQATAEVLTTRGDWGVALSADSVVTLEFGSYTDTSLIAQAEAVNSANAAAQVAASNVTADATANSGGLSNAVTIGAVVLALLLLVGVIVLVMSGRRPA